MEEKLLKKTEKQSKIRKFLGRLAGSEKQSQTVEPADTIEIVGTGDAGEKSQSELTNKRESVATVSPSSPFATTATIKPIGSGVQNFSEEIQQPQSQLEPLKEAEPPKEGTAEVMDLLAKVETQARAAVNSDDIHEVSLDTKTDIGWEADLEKAAKEILTMAPEEFTQTYGVDINNAKIAARYNMIEIIDDVLKNGNRSHAFDRIVDMARNINEKGHNEQLVVVGEFTYIVDKKI